MYCVVYCQIGHSTAEGEVSIISLALLHHWSGAQHSGTLCSDCLPVNSHSIMIKHTPAATFKQIQAHQALVLISPQQDGLEDGSLCHCMPMTLVQ